MSDELSNIRKRNVIDENENENENEDENEDENENEDEYEDEDENENYVIYSPYDPELYDLTRGELKCVIISNICVIFLYLCIITYIIYTTE